jgi:hypothetical protein
LKLLLAMASTVFVLLVAWAVVFNVVLGGAK